MMRTPKFRAFVNGQMKVPTTIEFDDEIGGGVS